MTSETEPRHYIARWRTWTGQPNFLVFDNRGAAEKFLEQKRAGGACDCGIEEYRPHSVGSS